MTITIPAGTYFLGDPCYAVPDADWDDLLAQTGFFDADAAGTVRGHTVVAFRVHGDGEYRDDNGHAYSTDASLLGVTPLALANPTGDPGRATWLADSGQVVTFPDPVVAADEGGVLSFGPYRISTADDAEDTCGECGGDLDGIGFCLADCEEDPADGWGMDYDDDDTLAWVD